MVWYSKVVYAGLLVVTVLVTTSLCSSLICEPEGFVLTGNCSTTKNCTDNAIVHFLNPNYKLDCTEIENATKHVCTYENYTASNIELGVKIPGLNGERYFRIPDKNMYASSNPEDASRARIGIRAIGQYKGAWCADDSNDSSPWLDVKFDVPAVIEKIEIKDYEWQWVKQFTLEYTDSTGQVLPYNNNMTFNSTAKGSCHYVFISQAKKVRLYSKSFANRTCLQLAIYGKLPNDVSPSEVVPADPVNATSKYNILERDSIANDWFLGGYMLWAVFIALLIFLVIFTLSFLFCRCCRKDYPLKSAMEKAKEANPDYVPAWRRVDVKAEKGYIATQETQEVKIAFTDEYIPPGLLKEKQDATDEKFYQHRIFSFSGTLPAGTTVIQKDSKPTEENGTTSK